MKLSRISLAMAATCGALASAPAFAVPASSYSNTGEFTGNTLNIRISGATAQDNGVLGSALSLCVAGTVHRYAIANDFVFFCNPDIGTSAGQITVPARAATNGGPITQLAIYKYSVGGSAFGVTTINSTNNASSGAALGADGQLLPFLDLSKIAASCTGANATSVISTFGPGTNGSYNNVSCGNASSALTTNAATYIGLSDVEPEFFSNKTSNITRGQASALIFAPVVTKVVYDRLQSLQGLTAPACGATLDDEGCMPSLTSAQLASLFTQAGQSWSALGVTGLTNDPVYLARRVDSSGTQKTFEALIAHSPNGESANKNCNVNTELFVLPDSGNTTTGDNESVCLASGCPATVMAGSGGGNLRNCLNNHNSEGRGAIGILTTEDAPSANWRFVKVDGVTPNQAQTAAGKYRFYTETSINTRKAGVGATNATEGYTGFVNRLIADLSNKTIVKQINGSPKLGIGNAGLMALLSRQTAAPDNVADFSGANSIVPWTKLVGGSTLDNCQAPKAVF